MGRRERRRGARGPLSPAQKSRTHPTDLPSDTAAEDIFTYVLDRPDVIRQRAQYAAAVAGVVAGTITAAALSTLGTLTDIATAGLLIAVAAWVVTLGLWVLTIGGERQPIDQHLVEEPPGVNLKEAIQQAKANAEKARTRLRRARYATVVAVAVTVAAVGWAGYRAEQEDERVEADLWLTPQGARATARSCGWRKRYRLIHGEVVLKELTRPVVTLQINDRKLRLRSSTVLSAAKFGGDQRARHRHGACS